MGKAGVTGRVERAGVQVAAEMAHWVEVALLPGSGVDPGAFWAGLAGLLADFAPENRRLLAVRHRMQAQIDAWHSARRGLGDDGAAYRGFLEEIGYLVPEGADFAIETTGVDREIAQVPGPQLVVPVMNARFALNAANARWGSLYDALYGTDAPGDLPPPGGPDAQRVRRVVRWAKAHLDRAVPLAGALWAEVTGLSVVGGALAVTTAAGPVALRDPGQFAGWLQDDLCAWQILLRVNGLLIELLVDPASPQGAADPAGISDIWVEAALTAIMDCEDSVAAVDAADKVLAWDNWLGLMRGDLSAQVTKGGKATTRRLNPDAVYHAAGGGDLAVTCRAVMWVRNVGHLMTSPSVLDAAGQEAPEGLLDALVTVTAALHDRRKTQGPRNSATGAVYVVKPKMHGPEEVAFAVAVLDRVEDILGLPRDTVKLGIMDEERRTSANLKECIRAARRRVAFINTGFLDRTGDEIHTAMEAGPMVPKGEMKGQPWIRAYERRNVDIGLACGLAGRAQIGKGMWAMPDRMAEMLAVKIAHPMAGASCAWVPSPAAATLHALHYHLVDVRARQAAIAAEGPAATLDDLLTLPLATGRSFSAAEVAREVENNAQGILGYVVRWVDQGIGCSKVPDIHDVALMEDRATCRISAQAMANWLHHGVVSAAEVEVAMRRMAAVVDRQNAGDPAYRPMAPGFDGPAYRAALALVLDGRVQPSGYTEPLLHRWRQVAKAAGAPSVT